MLMRETAVLLEREHDRANALEEELQHAKGSLEFERLRISDLDEAIHKKEIAYMEKAEQELRTKQVAQEVERHLNATKEELENTRTEQEKLQEEINKLHERLKEREEANKALRQELESAKKHSDDDDKEMDPD
jgi:chromosome segregation ATPase